MAEEKAVQENGNKPEENSAQTAETTASDHGDEDNNIASTCTTPQSAASLKATLVAEMQEHLPDIVKCLQEGELTNEDQKKCLSELLASAEQCPTSGDVDKAPESEGQSQQTAQADAQEAGPDPSNGTEEKPSEADRFADFCTGSEEMASALQQALQELQLNKAVEALESYLKQRQAEQEAEPQTPATRSYKDVLKDSTGTFVDTLKLDRALLRLLEKSSVLNPDMVGKVLCRPNRPDKVRELMAMMMELGPQSVKAFTEALRTTEQHFLANILAANEYV